MTESDLELPESFLDSDALGTGTFSIFNWTTLVGQPEFNELRQGVYDVHIHLETDGPGKKPVIVTPKLYNISADGLTRTLLVTFETTDLLLSVGTEFNLHGVLVDPIMLDNGVRLNLELEAEVGAGGGDVTVTIIMEGTTDSHLSIQTSTNAFEKIFIRRDGTNTLVGDWQVDSNVNPFNIDMFGNFSTGGLTVNGPTSLQGNMDIGGFNITNTNDVNASSFTLNDTTINDWDDIVSNVSINFGANESDTSGPSIPFLLTNEGVLKIDVVDSGSGSTIWEQVLSEIRNIAGNIFNFTGSIIASGDITTEDRFFLGNNASIGWNETCTFIFYNQTGSIIETKGCV